jgi:RNA recognition motif-containing protein
MKNQNLFVGNFNFETMEEDVKALFSTYGTVNSIRFRPKRGIAFVEMSTPEEATTALQKLDQTEFKDRILRISFELFKKKAKAVTRERRRVMSKKLSEKD